MTCVLPYCMVCLVSVVWYGICECGRVVGVSVRVVCVLMSCMVRMCVGVCMCGRMWVGGCACVCACVHVCVCMCVCAHTRV